MVTKGNNIAAEMVCKARLHRTHGTLATTYEYA
jgi:hypothetical protein